MLHFFQSQVSRDHLSELLTHVFNSTVYYITVYHSVLGHSTDRCFSKNINHGQSLSLLDFSCPWGIRPWRFLAMHQIDLPSRTSKQMDNEYYIYIYIYMISIPCIHTSNYVYIYIYRCISISYVCIATASTCAMPATSFGIRMIIEGWGTPWMILCGVWTIAAFKTFTSSL